MPDDGSDPIPAPSRSALRGEDVPAGGIIRDMIDVRDRFYEPSLRALPRECLPPEELLTTLSASEDSWLLPRTQGTEGTCGGQALAALIDLERLRAGLREPSPVSARMIYTMAQRNDDSGWQGAGVSLRDVIKGFYNYGVCLEARWPYVPYRPHGYLDLERAREARAVSLGAYFRLRPNLNAYHSAVHEAGAVLVSAELHDGWLHARVRDAGGKVVAPGRGKPRGDLASECHAFLIVGYTEEGFIVLNSWGAGWGGLPVGGAPRPGLGLWRYEDWADTIVDGWVLRLGVGPADAFEFSIGDQGLGFGPDAAVRSTPVHAILGNFLHLDDGQYVGHGSFVSTRVTLQETKTLLIEDARKPRPYKGVLLTFASALLGLKDAVDQIARRKPLVRGAGWYPLTVLWCVDYVDQARGVLEGVFQEAEARVGKPGKDLDRLIEARAHGVGRAFWRDILQAADAAARGPLRDLTRAAVDLAAARPAFRLRIVAESEGALALDALLRRLESEECAAERRVLFDMLDSVDLIAPPLSDDEFRTLADRLDRGWGPGRPERQLHVHLPAGRDECRLAVPPYGRSYFDLVQRAFLARRDRPAGPDGARRRARPTAVGPTWDAWAAAPRTGLLAIRWDRSRPPPSQGAVNQIQLLYRSDVDGRVRAILRRRVPSRPGAAAGA